MPPQTKSADPRITTASPLRLAFLLGAVLRDPALQPAAPRRRRVPQKEIKLMRSLKKSPTPRAMRGRAANLLSANAPETTAAPLSVQQLQQNFVARRCALPPMVARAVAEAAFSTMEAAR